MKDGVYPRTCMWKKVISRSPHVVFKACSVICITDGQCRPMEDRPLSDWQCQSVQLDDGDMWGFEVGTVDALDGEGPIPVVFHRAGSS